MNRLQTLLSNSTCGATPWLKQREHDHDTRTSAGAAVSDADAYHMVHTAHMGSRREWKWGGWKVKDIGVVVVGSG
jgi:hypothetical protein